MAVPQYQQRYLPPAEVSRQVNPYLPPVEVPHEPRPYAAPGFGQLSTHPPALRRPSNNRPQSSLTSPHEQPPNNSTNNINGNNGGGGGGGGGGVNGNGNANGNSKGRIHRPLQPAPPRPPPKPYKKPVTFFDLPAEIRVAVYTLALRRVIIHILPPGASEVAHIHALARTSWQVRREVLPLIHTLCRVESVVTDFNFAGIMNWLSVLPADEQAHLAKNESLHIRLCFTGEWPSRYLESLRRWLHDRADPCRIQPEWTYSGPSPDTRVANDLKRRWRRMKEARKRDVLRRMVGGIGITMKRREVREVRTDEWDAEAEIEVESD